MSSTGLARLSDDERRALLGSRSLGRIALRIGEEPTILPVNYVLLDGDVVFRAGPGRSSRPRSWACRSRSRWTTRPDREVPGGACSSSATPRRSASTRGGCPGAGSSAAGAAVLIGTFGPVLGSGGAPTISGMLVYDFLLLTAPFDEVTQWFRAPPDDVFDHAGSVAFANGPGEGRLQRGALRLRNDALVLDVRWNGKLGLGAFDCFEGELQLAPLMQAASHLSLSAHYAAPEEAQWDSIERLRAHREAEVRVRQFLRMLGASLDGTTTTG